MTKFERNEEGKYECPECERTYDKYNSVYQHYNLKHGNSPIVEKVNRTGKSRTNKTKETLKTVTKGIMGSDSENNIADDDNESSENENNASNRTVPKKTKRVRLKPVEPPVKKPQKARENEEENEEETESETWIIPGILKVSSKNKKKLSQEDVDKKWLLLEGIL